MSSPLQSLALALAGLGWQTLPVSVVVAPAISLSEAVRGYRRSSRRMAEWRPDREPTPHRHPDKTAASRRCKFACTGGKVSFSYAHGDS